MRKMTAEEKAMASELFQSSDMPPPHKGEGDTHLTVRFDSSMPNAVYYGPHARKIKVRIPGATVLRFIVDSSAKTPTGGKYIRQTVWVRTSDGRKWRGQAKSGTDVIILRRIKDEP